MPADYLHKLEHIRGAVAHQMYEDEGNWFMDLKSMGTAAEQRQIAFRYEEESSRCVGTNAVSAIPNWSVNK